MGGIDDLPSDKNILDFKNKHKLHMSCNLVSGYIDSEEQIIKYLEYAHSLGVYDIGIVDLMQVNAFCKGHYVGLDSIPFQSNKQFIQSRFHENIDGCNEVCCRCINWLYRTNDNKGLLSLYYRHAVKSATIADYLVYENNHITQGFSGKMLV
jgi:hypothetical protein